MSIYQLADSDIKNYREIQDATSEQIWSLSTSQDAVIYNTSTTLQHVKDMSRMMGFLVPTFAHLAIRPQLQDSIRKVAATPSHVLGATQELTQMEKDAMVTSKMRPYSCCTCRPRKTSLESRCRLGPLILVYTTETTNRHYENCWFYLPPRATLRQVGLRFQVSTTSRKWDVKAAVNYNSAAGAFSINPTVSFKATVPCDHPAFRILDVGDLGNDFYDKSFPCDVLLDSLLHIFRNGKGSPTDIDTSGRTLLKVSALGSMVHQHLVSLKSDRPH